jgi:hypothetical protein
MLVLLVDRAFEHLLIDNAIPMPQQYAGWVGPNRSRNKPNITETVCRPIAVVCKIDPKEVARKP